MKYFSDTLLANSVMSSRATTFQVGVNCTSTDCTF